MTKNIIYCFWTGQNEMSYNRQRCFETMSKSNSEIILITKDNLSNYIKKEYPLHPAYEYLSLTHKSDYLRCYFMHHYGGGYSDIKEITTSWNQSFNDLLDENYWINGYPEVSPNAVAQVKYPLYLELRSNYKKLIGCGSFICKPYTPFTYDWINELNSKLDGAYLGLKFNPAIHPQEKPGMIINGKRSLYPIQWTEILGNIFHPLCLKYHDKIIKTVPPCIFNNYR